MDQTYVKMYYNPSQQTYVKQIMYNNVHTQTCNSLVFGKDCKTLSNVIDSESSVWEVESQGTGAYRMNRKKRLCFLLYDTPQPNDHLMYLIQQY